MGGLFPSFFRGYMESLITSNLLQAPMSVDGYKVGNRETDKIAFYDGDPISQPESLTPSLTIISFDEPDTPNFSLTGLTNVLPFGFSSMDDIKTLLMVMENLQVRLNEVEARLESLGLIASN